MSPQIVDVKLQRIASEQETKYAADDYGKDEKRHGKIKYEASCQSVFHDDTSSA